MRCVHALTCAARHKSCSIKDAHAKAPAEFKAYYECLDYYRCVCGRELGWEEGCTWDQWSEGRALASSSRHCGAASAFHCQTLVTTNPLCHAPRSCSNKFEKCRKQQEAFEAAFKAKAE